MMIVKLDPHRNGAHENATEYGAIPSGWAVVSENLEIPETFPFVKNIVQDDGGMVISWEPDRESYDSAMAEYDPLANEIEKRIQQSKADLAEYLESHPIQWTDGKYYPAAGCPAGRPGSQPDSDPDLAER